jgi:hypothetical protein
MRSDYVMENKKLKIKLSDGRELIAEVNELDSDNAELAVYTVDNTDKHDIVYQDICLVREGAKNDVECLVWSDLNNEDYTDYFSIGKFESEE